MPAAYTILRVTTDTGTWTAVTAPHDCTTVTISASDGNAFKVRTNSADSGTELTVAGSAVKSIQTQSGSYAIPFPAGAVACYLLATVGTGPVVVEFTR